MPGGVVRTTEKLTFISFSGKLHRQLSVVPYMLYIGASHKVSLSSVKMASLEGP